MTVKEIEAGAGSPCTGLCFCRITAFLENLTPLQSATRRAVLPRIRSRSTSAKPPSTASMSRPVLAGVA